MLEERGPIGTELMEPRCVDRARDRFREGTELRAGSAVRKITQGCIGLLGPLGASREHLLEKWARDCRITDIYEGTGQIQRLIIARGLLDYSREELN